jgi:hypothetical protein
MYRVAYTSPTVGHRPYHQTDPYAASHLSGMGQSRPFEPMFLHGLGSVPTEDTLAAFRDDGYDMGVIHTLVVMGATEEQLSDLLANYAPGTPEFADVASSLMNQFGGAQAAPGAPSTSARSFPQAAIPTEISTAFGVYDLAQESAWHEISGVFADTQQKVQDLASKAPADLEVRQIVSDFNSLVMRYADYYTQAFGDPPSPLPLASWPTMSGLGIAPVVIIGAIAAGVLAVLAGVYLLNQRTDLANQRIDLELRREAVQKLGPGATSGDVLAAERGKPATTDWTVWFQTNAKWFALVAIGMVVAGPLTSGIVGGGKRR